MRLVLKEMFVTILSSEDIYMAIAKMSTETTLKRTNVFIPQESKVIIAKIKMKLSPSPTRFLIPSTPETKISKPVKIIKRTIKLFISCFLS
jgi:hypothetical protein